ncbi:MAG: MBL fold metallo-hydrolase [Planctomycetota bacterium]
MTLLLDTPPGEDGVVVQRCGLWGYNAIGVVSGDEAVAVDPGITPNEIESFRAALEADGARRVTHVLLTHSHHDHIRGWHCFPGARVVAPRTVADKPEKSRARILAGKRKVEERMGVHDPGFAYPTIDETFEEEGEIRVGQLGLELRSLPGHSDCTSIALVPELKALLSADYLVSPGLPYCRWEVEPFEAAHRELRRLIQDREIDLVLPAHNDLLQSRSAALEAVEEELSYFAFLREEVARQLRRREAKSLREDQVLKACAAAMAERRGVDLGPKARQDADNARRLIKELDGKG